MKKNTKGFTLLEVTVVVIIIGILASIGVPLYMKSVERGRAAEASQILGLIRMSENTYYFEWDGYVDDYRALDIFDVPQSGCDEKHYFWYEFDGTSSASTYYIRAHRCQTGEGGKPPDSSYDYTISIDKDGNITSDPPGFI